MHFFSSLFSQSVCVVKGKNDGRRYCQKSSAQTGQQKKTEEAQTDFRPWSSLHSNRAFNFLRHIAASLATGNECQYHLPSVCRFKRTPSANKLHLEHWWRQGRQKTKEEALCKKGATHTVKQSQQQQSIDCSLAIPCFFICLFTTAGNEVREKSSVLKIECNLESRKKQPNLNVNLQEWQPTTYTSSADDNKLSLIANLNCQLVWRTCARCSGTAVVLGHSSWKCKSVSKMPRHTIITVKKATSHST